MLVARNHATRISRAIRLRRSSPTPATGYAGMTDRIEHFRRGPGLDLAVVSAPRDAARSQYASGQRHHAHPLPALWGGGTLSSSDGQRFPQRGRSLTARALSRYFLDEDTPPTPMSPINTPPTAPWSSRPRGARPWQGWAESSATQRDQSPTRCSLQTDAFEA